jgi:hypothetical protein
MEAIEPLSSRAYQLADEYQLGTVRAEYHDNNQLSWSYLVLFLLVGATLLFGGFFVLRSSSINFTDPDRLGFFVQISMAMLFGLIILLLGLRSSLYRLKTSLQGELHFYVCTKGFVTARTHMTEVVHWEDIEAFQRHILYSPHIGKKRKQDTLDDLPMSCYLVQTDNNKNHLFQREPGEAIEQELATYLLPQFIAKFHKNMRLDFGWLVLNTKGIQLNTTFAEEPHHARNFVNKNPGLMLTLAQFNRKQVSGGSSVTTGKLFLPWNELEMMWIDESKSTLIISQKNERKHWAVLPLNRIKNVVICLALVRRIIENKTYEIA